MEKVFLDTSFLFAFYNADDEDHIKAIDIANELSDRNTIFVISDYIIDELLTLLLSRVGKLKTIKLCNDLVDDIREGLLTIIYVNYEVFAGALKIFINFEDKEWSFTDCTSFVLIKKEKINKAISFDEHFSQFGIEILP